MLIDIEGIVTRVKVGPEDDIGKTKYTTLFVCLKSEKGNCALYFPVRGDQISCLPIQAALNNQRIRYVHKADHWCESSVDYGSLDNYEITMLDGPFKGNKYKAETFE